MAGCPFNGEPTPRGLNACRSGMTATTNSLYGLAGSVLSLIAWSHTDN
jgi:hypothetical protein